MKHYLEPILNPSFLGDTHSSKKILLSSILFGGILFNNAAWSASNYYYNCPHKEVKQTRVLELQFHSQLSTAPCQVVYHKPKTEPKILWEAWNEEGYCEAKGEKFAEKLVGWGWMCERVDDWYIPEAKKDSNSQSDISFEDALAKRKIQLQIQGQQLEEKGLQQKAKKNGLPPSNTPIKEAANSETSSKKEPAVPQGLANEETSKTDWEKKMEELQQRKAEAMKQSAAVSSPST